MLKIIHVNTTQPFQEKFYAIEFEILANSGNLTSDKILDFLLFSRVFQATNQKTSF